MGKICRVWVICPCFQDVRAFLRVKTEVTAMGRIDGVCGYWSSTSGESVDFRYTNDLETDVDWFSMLHPLV